MALRAVVEHPKFAHLKSILNQPRCHVLGYLESLWHFCGRFTPAGNIGKYADNEIEAWIEWPGEPGVLISSLVQARWLDKDSNYRLVVHDWQKHADATTKLALKRSQTDFVVTVSRHSPNTVGTVSRQSGLSVNNSETLSGLPEPVPVPGAGTGAGPEPEPAEVATFSAAPLEPKNGPPSRFPPFPSGEEEFDLAKGFHEFWNVYPSKGRTKIIDARQFYMETVSPDPKRLHEALIGPLRPGGKWVESANWKRGFVFGICDYIRNRRDLEEPERHDPNARAPNGKPTVADQARELLRKEKERKDATR